MWMNHDTVDGCEILHQLIDGKHHIIHRVLTILLVVQDFFHPQYNHDESEDDPMDPKWLVSGVTLATGRIYWMRTSAGEQNKLEYNIYNYILVGGLEHGFYDFPSIGNVIIIIPTDFHIIFRGLETTNQYIYICHIRNTSKFCMSETMSE